MTKKLALCGMLTALAMICGYVEALIPFSFGIPGIKLGLANIVIVIALYQLTFYQTLCIQIARIVLISFMFGNMSMMMYSLAGGLLSLCVMALLKKTELFSISGVSVAGGVSHNIGQLLVAILVVNNLKIVVYFQILILAGLITGLLIGAIAYRISIILSKNKIS